MRWKTTGILLLSAALLLAFIFLFERRLQSTGAPPPPPSRLIDIKPQNVASIQLRRTNQFVLRAERTNRTWNLVAPVNYPAQNYAIDHLLNTLAGLSSYTYISPEELKAARRTVAEYGLDVPVASLTLQHNGARIELLFGGMAPSGDLAYFQLLNTPGVYVVPAEVLSRLPRTANEWRDISLINLEGLPVDRFEVRSQGPQGRGFAIQSTNAQFYLTRPSPARADRAKVIALLRKVQTEPVIAFVADDAQGELEAFGLEPPEAELVFGEGTNDLVTVQFGKSPSNDVVYARRLLNNNVVLVSRSALEAVQVPALELRDRHLVSFDPAGIDLIEISGEETFHVRRQGSNSWVVSEPLPMLADSELVHECLNVLAAAEGDVEKDVVTDFGLYGLAKPIRRYSLKSSGTNASEIQTNRLVTQLDIGGRRNGRIFARGSDPTVYTVDPSFADRLPVAAWQLRDRRVWSFTTNQITRLTIQHKGSVQRLLRGTGGEWKLDAGSVGIINTYAVEETIHRLGELRAAVWVDRGEGKRQLYGFRENGDKLLIELKGAEKSRVISVEFGDKAASGYPYALAVVDGETWIFEFPLQLYLVVARNLLHPAGPASTAKASL